MLDSTAQYDLDREKLMDVVHWICANSDSSELGRVKLHKILYFVDMFWYVGHGRPMTGETYVRQQFGPTAKNLSWVLNKLCEQGLLQVSKREFYGYEKTDFISQCAPQSNRISADEKTLLETVKDFVLSKSAKEISELSHHIPWQLCDNGEELPYETALLMMPVEVTEDDVTWGVQEARKVATEDEKDRLLGSG